MPEEERSLDESCGPVRKSLMRHLIAVGIILVLVLVVFGDVLVSSEPNVLSKKDMDIELHFLHYREFGSVEMLSGNLPQWNPSVFSGLPFYASFQSALLYPPNLILYSALPTWRAVNFDIVLHVLMFGVFLYGWLCACGASRTGALLAAALAMFSGPFFLRIYAGHLTMLAAMAWVPLILWAIEEQLARASGRWWLVFVFAAAMQLLSGHPQTAFFTGVVAELYAFCRVLSRPKRLPVLPLIAAGWILAQMLVAVQVLPGLEITQGESARAAGLSYAEAGTFSMPPENLLTMISAAPMGDREQALYWGRWFHWEASCWFGLTGLALALIGFVKAPRSRRKAALLLTLLLLTLSLGKYLPLHRLLYRFVPPFNSVRGMGRFAFFAVLMMMPMVALGFDALQTRKRLCRRAALVCLVCGIMAAALALMFRLDYKFGDVGMTREIVTAVRDTGETVLQKDFTGNPTFLRKAGWHLWRSLAQVSATLLALFLLLLLGSKHRLFLWGILILALMEILLFTHAQRPVFQPDFERFKDLEQQLEKRPGDYRILLRQDSNSVMQIGARNVWGYDPVAPARYTALLSHIACIPSVGNQPWSILQDRPGLARMLRCRYEAVNTESGIELKEIAKPIKRVALMNRFRVLSERGQVLEALLNKDFDPAVEVILESEPPIHIGETDGVAGVARVVEESTDHLVIDADLTTRAILLISDAYARGWRARAQDGSALAIQPANLIMRAIALDAGNHRIRMEYRPESFRRGVKISLVGLLVFSLLFAWFFRDVSHCLFSWFYRRIRKSEPVDE